MHFLIANEEIYLHMRNNNKKQKNEEPIHFIARY